MKKRKQKIEERMKKIADQQKISALFIKDITKLFDKYINKYGDKIRLYELINSADLFIDTLKQENKNPLFKNG